MPFPRLFSTTMLLLALVLLGATTSQAATIHGPYVHGSASATTAANSSITIKPKLTVRRHSLTVKATACKTADCSKYIANGRTAKTFAPGSYRRSFTLTLPTTTRIQLKYVSHGEVLYRHTYKVPGQTSPPTNPPTEPPTTPPVDNNPKTFSLTTTPAITPVFDQNTTDYAVDCPDNSLRFQVALPTGQTFQLGDNTAVDGGTVDTTADIAPNQETVFQVNNSTYHVRCLPSDFPKWTATGTLSNAIGGFAFSPNLATPTVEPYAIIADKHGTPVWWKADPDNGTPIDIKPLQDGTLVWAQYNGGGFSNTKYVHVTLDGQRLPDIASAPDGIDHHELQEMPNGNFLVAAYVPRQHVDLTSLGGPADATVIDALIKEITPAGVTVWSWNSADHIDLAESGVFGLANEATSYNNQPAYDIIHINSLQPDGDGIVFSGRHLDAVYRINMSDGSIDWKLGGSPRPESLTFVNDPSGSVRFGGQHDARILADGTLTVHDNGTLRGRAPQGVHYQIDTQHHTATLLDSVQDSRVPGSNCCGSARRLSDNNWLMSWGGDSRVTELDPNGQPLFTLTANQGFSYRANPIDSDQFNIQAYRDGMNSQYDG